MTEEQQRIAIAESLGIIKRREDPKDGGKYLYAWEILEGVAEGTFATIGRVMKHTPDYLNDLNACHEFEKALWDTEFYLYIEKLKRIVVSRHNCLHGVSFAEVSVVHAEAKHKCEAYLFAKGLWQGEGV